MERESANTQAEKQIQGMKDLIESVTEEANGRRIWNGVCVRARVCAYHS